MLPEDDRAARAPRPRVVLHVDLDAFFVQVERKLNPTLIGACEVSSFMCVRLSSLLAFLLERQQERTYCSAAADSE